MVLYQIINNTIFFCVNFLGSMHWEHLNTKTQWSIYSAIVKFCKLWGKETTYTNSKKIKHKCSSSNLPHFSLCFLFQRCFCYSYVLFLYVSLSSLIINHHDRVVEVSRREMDNKIRQGSLRTHEFGEGTRPPIQRREKVLHCVLLSSRAWCSSTHQQGVRGFGWRVERNL